MSSNSRGSRGAVTPCCSSRTLLAAAITCFVFSILAILFFICLRLLKLCRRGRRSARPPPVQQEQHRPKPGLDAAAIALLPSFPYRRGDAEGECSVCLGVLDEGQMVRQLPGCTHVFHQQCVDVWLASNASCPVCRGKAEPAPVEEGSAASIVHVATTETLEDASVAATSLTPTGTEIWRTTRLEDGSCLA